MIRSILAPFDVLALVAVALTLGGCSPPAGKIWSHSVHLSGLTGALAGTETGTRIRYDGPEQGFGFRYVIEGADGELEVRDIGTSFDDGPLSIDGVAAVTLESFGLGGLEGELLTVRFHYSSSSPATEGGTAGRGTGTWTSRSIVEGWPPEGAGGSSGRSLRDPVRGETDDEEPVILLEQEAVGPDGAIGRLRVEFFVFTPDP